MENQVQIDVPQALREIAAVVEAAALPKAQHVYLGQCIEAVAKVIGDWVKAREDLRKAEIIAQSAVEAEKKTL